ncbi:ShKT domain-containing protein [Caenorhabditis elegans]|uniref:ShKT domain-containing protein n=1 Tax=Caenorhabditis elegans TaxID=6239 RepID=O44587_CAEEL|nr:ShKT domain-containing protein [Caenorhabditis elegans]CCD70353.1 ShKT domain-containing protein [Caenorhabditis elegans]|eukprot:NP_503270.1 Uncharacterized protein CELE_F48G7.8 [Caenorhabditis elegans]
MLLRVVFLTFVILWAGAEIQLGCKSTPFRKGVNPCPPHFTELPGGLCCSDDDVYIISDNDTTLSPTTTTTAAPCQDRLNPATGVSDCPMRRNLCTDPNYRKMMHEQCPKTCGFCTTGSTTKAPACSDKVDPRTGVSDCPQKKYLCTDPTYKGLMKDKCPKTCGYC